MQPIAFCNRCGNMKVGGNWRYVSHSLICKEILTGSVKVLILIGFISIWLFAVQGSNPDMLSELGPDQASKATIEASLIPVQNPSVGAVKSLLKRYESDGAQRDRVATAIVHSSRKHSLDPRLVASIMIVESRGNPFAISESNSIGIMQIHLPTWGDTADKEGINLFKVEDNVEFGVRILKDYIRQYGTWDGVKRYKGWNSENPDSALSADQYVEKVQRVYGYAKPSTETVHKKS